MVQIGLLALAGVSRGADNAMDVPQIDGITIDRKTDDWADRGFRVNVMAPANGAPLTENSEDARFRLAWDRRGLLVQATVHHGASAGDAKAKESVEVLVCRPGTIDRYLTTVLPNHAAAEAVWFGTDLRQQMVDRKRPLVASAAVTTAGDQYVVEALLPWANLSIDPQPGATVQVQVRVNHGSEQYRWNPGAGNKVEYTNLIRLSPTNTGPAENGAMAGRYERLRRIRMSVFSTGEFAGKKVDVMDGDHVLASGMLSPIGSLAQTALVLPMPAVGKSYGPITARVENHMIATVSVPDAQPLREDAIASAPFLFKPFVFSGDHFPGCEFEDPSVVDELFGPYTLKTYFYDADFNPVKQPTKAGRYGAVVEVHSEETGKTFKRYCTLYRLAGEVDWNQIQLPQATELPPAFGIPPAVARQQIGAISQQWQYALRDSVSRDPTTAILLAALSETPADTPPMTVKTDPAVTDQQWWYHLKRKTGDYANLYLTYFPKDYDKDKNRRWPVILFLHGAGERGDDLNRLKTWVIPLYCEQGKNSEFIAICPLLPARESWLAMALNDLLDEAIGKYRIDPDRVYVTGAHVGGNAHLAIRAAISKSGGRDRACVWRW